MEEDENLSSVCEDGTDVSGGDVATEKILKFSISVFHVCPILNPGPHGPAT